MKNTPDRSDFGSLGRKGVRRAAGMLYLCSTKQMIWCRDDPWGVHVGQEKQSGRPTGRPYKEKSLIRDRKNTTNYEKDENRGTACGCAVHGRRLWRYKSGQRELRGVQLLCFPPRGLYRTVGTGAVYVPRPTGPKERNLQTGEPQMTLFFRQVFFNYEFI